MRSSLQLAFGEDGEPGLHEVDPRRIRRCEMHVETRMSSEPSTNRHGLVCRVVVEDQMDIKMIRHRIVDDSQ